MSTPGHPTLALSGRALDLDYVDLFHIHWPNPDQDRYVDAFSGLRELQRTGLVRAIGASNLTPAQLPRLIEETGSAPEVTQLQISPSVVQEKGRAFAAKHGIVVQSPHTHLLPGRVGGD